MVVKKQLKKISKKILVLGLATSIIFTSCFSTKKIEVHAASVAAGLSAYTLYEICLYIGGLAVSTLGIGYVYDNRDEIAHFGKNIIDSLSNIPEQGWYFGATAPNQDPTIYGREALVAIQMAEWASIVLGGQMPDPNKNNNDDDDNENDDGNNENPDEILNDYEKRSNELGFVNFFLTSAGLNLFEDAFKSLYDSWVNKEQIDNVLNNQYGQIDALYFNGSQRINSSGYYEGYTIVNGYEFYAQSDEKLAILRRANFSTMYPDRVEYILYTNDADSDGYVDFYVEHQGSYSWTWDNYRFGGYCSSCGCLDSKDGANYVIYSELPIFNSYSEVENYVKSGDYTNCINLNKSFRIADWLADDNDWKGYLEDIATSLRSLEDLTTIAQLLSEGALTTQPSANEYGDMMDNLNTEYATSTDPISNPNYYPSTNTTPALDPSEIPNYLPSTNPDSGELPDNPSSGGTGDDEIDLDGLGSLFSILFYLIMIIIMLIYLFLACLSFIVMIFRIPASSSMLPEEMVLGFDHLKTIMIPGFNISIYGFAMALIYLLIIFTVIKILRLEINDFKFPRPGKKP